MKIASFPQIHEMPTHRELRNLTQCLYYATAKANSVTAFVGIMYYPALHVLTRAHKPGFTLSQDTITGQYWHNELSLCCLLVVVVFPSNKSLKKWHLSLHWWAGKQQTLQWPVHHTLNCPPASWSCRVQCSRPCCTVSCLRPRGFVRGLIGAKVHQLSSSPTMLVALSSLHNASIILSKWAEISETGGFNPPSESKHSLKKKKKGAIQTAKAK